MYVKDKNEEKDQKIQQKFLWVLTERERVIISCEVYISWL